MLFGFVFQNRRTPRRNRTWQSKSFSFEIILSYIPPVRNMILMYGRQNGLRLNNLK